MISVIIPVIRPEKANRCIEAIKANAGRYSEWLEIIAREDIYGVGCPEMVYRMTQDTAGDLVMFLGDDTIPQPGFMEAAMAAMGKFPDGCGLVGLNDGIHNGALATHWLAHRGMLQYLSGQFFSTEYRHCFCDRELTDIAKEIGRYAYAADARIIHDHPHVTREPMDAGYKKAYSSFDEDQRTYWRRKRKRIGGQLAIGFPLVDRTVPSPFFLSFSAMDKPSEWTLLAPRFPSGEFQTSIASVRNDLVEQALEHGCSHLLMMDTDQIYPADTIAKLSSHDADIVGVAVHRRYPPFDVIMLRGELGSYTHVSDEECYSGGLVEVDATGTGCMLIDTSVFIEMTKPWFEFGKAEDGHTIGEDLLFCSKARKLGKRIAVDTSIEVDHLSTFRVDRSTRKLWNKLKAA